MHTKHETCVISISDHLSIPNLNEGKVWKFHISGFVTLNRLIYLTLELEFKYLIRIRENSGSLAMVDFPQIEALTV